MDGSHGSEWKAISETHGANTVYEKYMICMHCYLELVVTVTLLKEDNGRHENETELELGYVARVRRFLN